MPNYYRMYHLVRFSSNSGRHIVGFIIAILTFWFDLAAAEDFSSDGFVFVEGGEFIMQEIDINGELVGPERKTEVSSFWIGSHMITVKKWDSVAEWAKDQGYVFYGTGCGETHPVLTRWYDALKWCNALSEMEGLKPVYYTDSEEKNVYRGQHRGDVVNVHVNWMSSGYRLPTEAEWEFAARGGRKSEGYAFSGSNELDRVAWYRANSGGAECGRWPEERGTWPVGKKEPNELRLYDMTGNLAEWCWDRYALYDLREHRDPRGANDGHYRVTRGGGYTSEEFNLWIARRLLAEPSGATGFRVVRSTSPGTTMP